MATNLIEIVEVINLFKSANTVFSSVNIPYKYAKWGVVGASVPLGKDLTFDLIFGEDSQEIVGGIVSPSLTTKETYLAGLYGYRFFAMQQHEEMASKAVNFKTINFAVSGLTERSKEMMRIVWWCDSEINRILKEIVPLPLGASEEMIYGGG